jgi:hypothetical protein
MPLVYKALEYGNLAAARPTLRLIDTGATVIASIWGRSLEDYRIAAEQMAGGPGLRSWQSRSTCHVRISKVAVQFLRTIGIWQLKWCAATADVRSTAVGQTQCEHPSDRGDRGGRAGCWRGSGHVDQHNVGARDRS